MKITTDHIPVLSLEEFADEHGLEMEIRERRVREGEANRFYASFRGVEIKGDGVLIGAHGDGATPEDAMADYATRIALTRIVVGAYTDARREIEVPRLRATRDTEDAP